MKFSHFLVLAGLLGASAASAQTTPASTNTTTRGTTQASPSAVPSGTMPVRSNPRGAVSAGEVFTKGAPSKKMSGDRSMKMKKNKSMMSDNAGKMNKM